MTSLCMFCDVGEDANDPEPAIGRLTDDTCRHCGASMFEALAPCASGVSVAGGTSGLLLDDSCDNFPGGDANTAGAFCRVDTQANPIDPALLPATLQRRAIDA